MRDEQYSKLQAKSIVLFSLFIGVERMQYRKLGKTGLEISEIGMGLSIYWIKEENIVIDTIAIACSVFCEAK